MNPKPTITPEPIPAPLEGTGPTDAADTPPREPSPRELRFGKGGGSLRKIAARGTIINAAFLVGLSLLGLIKGLAVANLISTSDYGFWGFLAATIASLIWLKQVGIQDKYVQQDESDQELAFQRAFTLELIATLFFFGLMLAVIPVLAFVYGLREVVAPGLVLALGMPALALQAPIWIFIRRMRFVEQRALEAVGPVVSFVLTIVLAIAGYGYWSLVIGFTVGNWAAAIVSLIACPYRIRLRFDRDSAMQYLSFSWPMFVAAIAILAMAQIPVLVATKALGLAAVGAIALANLIPLYARQASDAITQTMYPGVCAVKDRPDLLLEAFTKSNRLGILWGAPLGVALTLFAPALVEFVLGSKWEFAVGLLQAIGLITAVNQFGFNWTAFYRALGDTKPVGAAHVIQALAICGITVPLLVIWGLGGFAAGMGIATVVYTLVKYHYLARLFPRRSVIQHSLRAMVPTLAGAAAVLICRAVLDGGGGAEVAIFELLVYFATVGATTLLTEGALVREAVGYVRGRTHAQIPAA